MLWRLVAKIFLRAMVPLIMVAGVFSYGIYMRGGDPSIMWKSIATGGVVSIIGIFSDVQDDAGRAVGALSGKATGDGAAGQLERTEVYTWKGADGVTHYSTSAPSGVTAQTVTVDPNVNVLVPVKASVIVRTEQERRSSGQSATRTINASDTRGGRGQVNNRHSGGRQAGFNTDSASIAEVKSESGGTLPGVTGLILSNQSDLGGQGMDSSQLIRMLQSTGN